MRANAWPTMQLYSLRQHLLAVVVLTAAVLRVGALQKLLSISSRTRLLTFQTFPHQPLLLHNSSTTTCRCARVIAARPMVLATQAPPRRPFVTAEVSTALLRSARAHFCLLAHLSLYEAMRARRRAALLLLRAVSNNVLVMGHLDPGPSHMDMRIGMQLMLLKKPCRKSTSRRTKPPLTFEASRQML
jgi:hypothetical protein